MYKKGLKQLTSYLVLILIGMSASAQNGLNSPYSQYGIGITNMPYNMPSVSAMGGVVYTRSAFNTINPFNPASYASIGMESFVFDMGLGIEMTTLREGDASLYDADGNISYLTFGFPLTKWWKTAMGIMPMTDVSYRSVRAVTGEPWGEMNTIYEGFGGVTQFFWGHGFNLLGGNNMNKAQLRAGFNVNYLYGYITRAITYDFLGRDTTYFMDMQRRKETSISNFTFDFGLQYEQPIGKDYRFGAGVTLKMPRTMTVKDHAVVFTYGDSPRDTIFPASGGDSDYESTLRQAFSAGVGLSFQRNDKWLVAFDATFASWNGMEYTENSDFNIFGNSSLRYDKTCKFALGVQLLGDKNSSSYLRRITYSAGGHYENGRLYLQLSDGVNRRLDEWGFGLGASLPMRKGKSVLNLSVSYSSFGTIDLMRRDAVMVGISIGSCESWFVKRKFN